MSKINVLFILVLALLLVACDRGSQTATDTDTATAEDGATSAAETAQADQPSFDLYAYRTWSLDDLGNVDKLTAACEQEVSAMDVAMAALESFAAKPTIENYLEAYNAQMVSVSNMAMATNTLCKPCTSPTRP